MLNAFGSAGTQAAGLWEFLRDAADSKQLHTAKAAADGLLSAYLAQHGFTGAKRIFDGPQGMAAGMSTDADPAKLVSQLGDRWALTETSFKFHACCRHTHPAADALLQVVNDHNLTHDDITRVTAHVHQAAIDVLSAVDIPQSVHQAKFSMGTVLALIAVFHRAGLRNSKTTTPIHASRPFAAKSQWFPIPKSIAHIRPDGSAKSPSKPTTGRVLQAASKNHAAIPATP